MSIMDAARIAYLRNELDAERISMGELQEIEAAFAELDPATLPEPAENAMAGDMLDELYAYGVTYAVRNAQGSTQNEWEQDFQS